MNDGHGTTRRRHLLGPIQNIGDAHGRIALWLDYRGALDLAATFGPSDSAYGELMQAISRAYPEIEDDE